MDVDEQCRLTGTDAELRIQAAYGSSSRAERFYRMQMLDRLNPKMRAFVERQEMMFVSTADDAGRCDATFRAGPPGFVSVLDDKHVAWPEYRGNGVHASLANIADNPHAGILFMDFVRDIIGLHINGVASVVDDGDLRSDHPDLPIDTVPGRRPERWVVLEVEEAYIHCRKHIPRLAKVDHTQQWGTDDGRSKGGDFFDVANGSDPVPVEAAPIPTAPIPGAATTVPVPAPPPNAIPHVDAPFRRRALRRAAAMLPFRAAR